MIDATKLPRPARASALPRPGVSDALQSTAGAAKADAAADKIDQVATYPAQNLVLNGGRYYVADTKK